MGGPIELRLLTLQPFALGELPATTDELVREARAILDSPMWTGEKHWERGVETHSLPPGATTVTHRPSGEVEVDKTPGRRSRFFGGGKTHPSEADDSPSVAWHRRRSTALASEVGFEHYFRTLALSHTEQEAQYVETLAKIVKVPGSEDSYLKLYDLPWPTQNRSFISHVLVVPCVPTERLRSFLVFSLPIVPTERMGEEDGHVRGRYVAVEEVREIEVEEGGVTVLKIQWTCASRSTPGGSIPTKLAESYMASSMASHVPAFYAWLATSLPGVKERPATGHKRTTSLKSLRRSLSLKRPVHDDSGTSPTLDSAETLA